MRKTNVCQRAVTQVLTLQNLSQHKFLPKHDHLGLGFHYNMQIKKKDYMGNRRSKFDQTLRDKKQVTKQIYTNSLVSLYE